MFEGSHPQVPTRSALHATGGSAKQTPFSHVVPAPHVVVSHFNGPLSPPPLQAQATLPSQWPLPDEHSAPAQAEKGRARRHATRTCW